MPEAGTLTFCEPIRTKGPGCQQLTTVLLILTVEGASLDQIKFFALVEIQGATVRSNPYLSLQVTSDHDTVLVRSDGIDKRDCASASIIFKWYFVCG